ncbi:hypothetical protein AB9M62_21245 [Bacillales bacterium AN1005]
MINKENDANNFAEKLAQEIVLEKKTDEYGDFMYTSIVEDTSDFEFDTLQYDVQLKDSDGIVVAMSIFILKISYQEQNKS